MTRPFDKIFRCKRQRSWLASAILCSFASIGFWVQAIWALILHQQLTPVFKGIDCTLTFPKVTHVNLFGGFSVQFLTGTSCENLNPYELKLEGTQPVDVYMGDGWTKVATVEKIAESVLPPHGEGDIVVDVLMEMTKETWQGMMRNNFFAPIPIRLEVNVALDIDVNLIFGHLSIAKEFARQCGFNLQAFQGALVKVGPMACAEGWENLVLPPVGDTQFTGKLDLKAENLAADEISKGTAMKDVGLGMAMASGFIFGPLFMNVAVYCLYRLWQMRSMQARDMRTSEIEEGDPATAADAKTLHASKSGDSSPTLMNRDRSPDHKRAIKAEPAPPKNEDPDPELGPPTDSPSALAPNNQDEIVYT